MDTIRVSICYRPLRIAWAIREGDFDAFRRAVRYSNALWGGRFNPILIVDHEHESERLIDVFRVDFILPIGDSDEVKNFPAKYPFLINPLFHDSLFMKGTNGYRDWAQVVDVHNALAYLSDKPALQEIKETGVRLLSWQPDDPLADVFLSHFGGYPSVEEVGTDYRSLLREVSGGDEVTIEAGLAVPPRTIEHPSLSHFSGYGLSRHYNVPVGWNYPGFFLGTASNLDDLVCHWNLRACDIPLLFVDRQYLERQGDLITAWKERMKERVSRHRDEWNRQIALWTRSGDIEELSKDFGGERLLHCHVSAGTWNGLNIRPPTMQFGRASALGVLSTGEGKPKISFAHPDKPVSSDSWFHQQHLVASLSFIGGLYRDDLHTLRPPYLPELNEFYARTMHFMYNALRVEPGGIGLVIDATEQDSFLYALPIGDLTERVLGMAGYDSHLSAAGLIARQLIARLGGVQGARVFKVPGVRRLIRAHGPTASFTKKTALELIGKRDPENPSASFTDHENLHIEPRPPGTKLDPASVLGYLVEKGLLRIGVDLVCPGCNLRSWIPVDALGQLATCDLCGHKYDAGRQLTETDRWYYRRSGVLGIEKNAQGAVPVSLTLQQLHTSLHGIDTENIYSPSLELSPKAETAGSNCEVDLLWMISRAYPRRTAVILGECKDKGPITDAEIENLRRVADALPRKRFKTFVLLSQVVPFSNTEIEAAKTLNDQYRRRAILLTARELEPYFIYERTKIDLGIEGHGGTPEELADTTARIYFG